MQYKKLDGGMGVAVAKRTILRTKENGELENWYEVAERVANGNCMLLPKSLGFVKHQADDFYNLRDHIASGRLLMSGRHLQHGDENQPKRNMEVFTNCSTASTSFLLFYLLLNGSGVGRAYDDDMCVVDWDYAPDIKCVLSNTHPDFNWEEDESLEEAKRKYKNGNFIEVADSREGWAQVVEIIETLAYEKQHANRLMVFDFSKVRAKGTPIGGMQDRPASGPRPTMNAVQKAMSVKGSGMKPWEQAMWIDHYLAECVLVGGARRAARMATKWWEDEDILDFIKIKQGGYLWSANNSITVNEIFWKQNSLRSREVLETALNAAYHDQTGEPGFINQDKLVQDDEGLDEFMKGDFVGSQKYQLQAPTKNLMAHLLKVAQGKEHTQITNPCGEITLHMLGGYCVIADVVPYFADNDDQAEDAFRAATRALMRVNTMDSLYNNEVERTNRIGVGMTGVHEYAWKRFGFGFRDLVDEKKSKEFWETLRRFRDAVKDEADSYAEKLSVAKPHTLTTIKPAGTTSKLFALSEGAHLPSMKEYLRWVQFRADDPLVEKYKELGYPCKELKSYSGTTVIGFPTQPEICRLGMGDKLVTAAEATPSEQYEWLRLLEKYWISDERGNQVSYTLKYNPEKYTYEEFKKLITENQATVRCCSVMPQVDATAYEYQPEEPISNAKFVAIVDGIKDSDMTEDIDLEHLRCESGVCPI